MKSFKRLLLILLSVLLCATCFAPSIAATTQVKLSTSQKNTISNVLCTFLYTNYAYDKNGKSYYKDFDVKKATDKALIDAAVEFLYYPGTFPKTESWMKETKKTKAFEMVYSKSQVDKMCLQLFGKKPSAHGKTMWTYKSGYYYITGDAPEIISPKIASYKTLTNGDVQVNCDYYVYSDIGEEKKTGLSIVAVIRPSKTLWGFTLQSLKTSGNIA